MMLRITMLAALAVAQITEDLLTPNEQLVLKNSVDLVANFFKGFGKSKVASEIYEAYHIIDGEFTVAPKKQPCGEDDI